MTGAVSMQPFLETHVCVYCSYRLIGIYDLTKYLSISSSNIDKKSILTCPCCFGLLSYLLHHRSIWIKNLAQEYMKKSFALAVQILPAMILRDAYMISYMEKESITSSSSRLQPITLRDLVKVIKIKNT